MKKILFGLFLSVGLNADVLNVATTPNFPPYEYIENNELKGYDVDIINEIGKRLGVEINFKHMDFDALIPTLKSGKVDLIGAILKKTPVREKAVSFTIDFKQSSNYFLQKSDGKNVDEIPSCDKFDFSDKIFGTELGTVQYDIAKKLSKKEVKGFGGSSIAILALQSNKVDIVAVDKTAAKKFLEKNPDLSVICEYPDEAGQGFTVNKGNDELLEKLNKTLQDMLDDGTIEAIAKKYDI